MGGIVESNTIRNLLNLDTDHKSDIISAINELADIAEDSTMVVSFNRTSAELKDIYNKCIQYSELIKI